MSTATQTNWNGMSRNGMSLDIFDELNGVASEVKLINRYEHPEHPGSADWTITLYEYTLDGYKDRVIATNGSSIWEAAEPGEFNDTLEEYGIEL